MALLYKILRLLLQILVAEKYKYSNGGAATYFAGILLRSARRNR